MDTTGEKLIASLGFPPEITRIYERLQTLDGRPYEEVLDSLAMTAPEFEAVAASLLEADIVQIGAETVQVLNPALAISRMIEEAAGRARAAHDLLLSISRAVPYIASRSAGLPPAQLAEATQPIDGELFRSRHLPETLATLVQRTTGNLAWLRPDQWTLPWEEDMNNLVADVVASGRSVRSIYPLRALTAAPAVLQARVEIGESIRLLPEVATRLLVIGTTHAVVPEPLGSTDSPRMMLRQRGLVEALGLLFEELWARASPLAEFDKGAKSDAVRRHLLAQLASGAQDEQIARRLGLSLRTVRRRVAELMAELRAESRFQAGVEAARRGWL